MQRVKVTWNARPSSVVDFVGDREDGMVQADATMKGPAPELVETDIPARLDRLPWGRFHTLVVVALVSPGSSMDLK